MIYKEQIDLVPESPDVEFGDCQDYPPKMKLRFTPGSEPPVTSECKIQVEGLRREHCFNIPLYDSRPAEKPVEGIIAQVTDNAYSFQCSPTTVHVHGHDQFFPRPPRFFKH